MDNNIKVYNIATDELVSVTQEWCDNMQKGLNNLAKHREIVRRVLNLNTTRDEKKLDQIQNFLNTIGVI